MLFLRKVKVRGSASRFFSIIAPELAAREPGMLRGIKSALDADSGILEMALKDQSRSAILQPFWGYSRLARKSSLTLLL
ncbi:hypothetical protein GQ43DRAFT_75377, partial [Delitschia confertaspora ATCC 74209]